MVESTAAAMSYGLLVAGKKTVIVFDMGGGTTDVTIMSIDDGKFCVEATAGHNSCGGNDIDRELIGIVLDKITTGFISCFVKFYLLQHRFD